MCGFTAIQTPIWPHESLGQLPSQSDEISSFAPGDIIQAMPEVSGCSHMNWYTSSKHGDTSELPHGRLAPIGTLEKPKPEPSVPPWVKLRQLASMFGNDHRGLSVLNRSRGTAAIWRVSLWRPEDRLITISVTVSI
jgi:hypothetical protein